MQDLLYAPVSLSVLPQGNVRTAHIGSTRLLAGAVAVHGLCHFSSTAKFTHGS
jgi:hypothetical protein